MLGATKVLFDYYYTSGLRVSILLFSSSFSFTFTIETVSDEETHDETETYETLNNLRFCQINTNCITKITSTGSRVDYLKYFMVENNISVCALTETKLDVNVDESAINIENFQEYRKDRNRNGGGVAIYVRNDLSVQTLDILSFDGLESLWLKVEVNKITAVFGVCYRPPGQNLAEVDFFINSLYVTFDLLCEKFNNYAMVLLGDFNDRCTHWDSEHINSDMGFKFIDLLNSFGLIQLINEPTRGTNILDLLITNKRDCIINFEVGEPFTDLDHCPILGLLNLKIKKQNCYKRVIRLYNDENLSSLNDNLKNIPWQVLLSGDSECDDVVYTFTKIIQDEIKNCIPTKEVLIRPRDKPGMTSEVRRLFRRCNRLHKISQRTKNVYDIENHRAARKIAKRSWKLAKNLYLNKLYNRMENPETRNKTFWKLMKTLSANKIISIPTLIENEIKYETNLEKCEALNEYFVAQTRLDFNSEPILPILNVLSLNCLSNIETTTVEVIKILKSLDVSKSNGPDNIGNLILKLNAESLGEPMTFLINKSLKDGIFPSDWKQANVTPIFKKGSRQDIRNYRPISLLSSTSKILERVVYNHLYEHCQTNNLLSKRNSGFKQNDGAVNRLLYLVDRIYKGLDDEREIAMVFLDITKAFDRVWHKGLLFKLRGFGVSGLLLAWFKSYLENRSQRVVIGGVSSEFKYLFAGVPQGSVLGPLLFLIFLNDVEIDIISDISLFADDTALVQAYKFQAEAEDALNSDLVKIANWGKNGWLISTHIKQN